MTRVRTKQTSKASEKRERDSLAVTALENATVAALQVGDVEPGLPAFSLTIEVAGGCLKKKQESGHLEKNLTSRLL